MVYHAREHGRATYQACHVYDSVSFRMVSQVPQAGAHGRGGTVCGERTATALCRKRMDGRGAHHPGRSCPPVCGSQTERFALTYGEHAQRHYRPASLQAVSGGQAAGVGRLLLVSLLLRRLRRRHDADHCQEVSRTGAGLMRKAFKYRIYPNQETEQRLLWILSRCRELYHAALTELRDAYHFHVRQHPKCGLGPVGKPVYEQSGRGWPYLVQSRSQVHLASVFTVRTGQEERLVATLARV